MHCLHISLIFLLFFLTFSCNAESLYSKSYQESIRPLNKTIRIRDVIMNQHLLLPSGWTGTGDNLNQKLHEFIGYLHRKWKANQNKLNKKNQFSHTNKIYANPDANRRQIGLENFQESNVSIHSDQKRHRKLDHDPQQNQNSVQTQISGNESCIIPKWVNQNEIGKSLPIPNSNPCQPDPGRHCEFIYKKYTVKEEFIQCDKSGKALVKSCPSNSQWDNKVKKCLYSYISSNTSCTIPSWDNQNETGSKLPGYYINPCVSDRKRKCDYIYKIYKLKKTQFIQCDRSGKAVLKSCPPSFKWDKSSKICSLKTTMVMTSTEQSKKSKTTEYNVPATTAMTTKQTNKITTEKERGTTAIVSKESTKQSAVTTAESPTTKTVTTAESPTTKTVTTAESPTTKTVTTAESPTTKTQTTVYKVETSNAATISSIYMTTETKPPCKIPPWVNQTDNGTELPHYFQNPCKPRPNGHCEFTYKHHYIDTSKFIQCDRSGNARVKSCPTSFKWDDSVDQCIPEALSTTELPCLIPSWDNQTDNGTELPDFFQNPCKPQPNSHCKFTYKHHYIDTSKFIQCDRSGNARVKSCPTSFKWDDSVDQCIPEALSTTELPCLIPSWDNQTDNGTELPDFFQNPCKPQPNSHCKFTYKQHYIDTSKFIQCDRSGNARVKSCPTSFKWDDSVDQCIPEALSTTELPCLIPSWDNQTDNGTELPDYVQNPCKPQPNSHCKFTYKHHYIDISKFIQCDRSGNARVKSCPTSFKWDDSVDQCIPEALSTTELPCLIPSWDNQTDNGTELPDYVQNPCKPQPNSHCKFTYKHHYIDISKFIQCDRSGNARVKSCPTSFKWDDSVDQCIPEALSTTELPCLIPSWDNQTDNGTELPDYVQNPCKPQPNSHCKFTYKHHYIDISKFIQCDRSGNARVKSCPTSFKWDDSVDQCIPEALSTTELPCLIPSWDNQTDNGTELPDYVQNPCKPQPNSHCKFTYKHHYIDISKFIQCDRSGNARVKSCPTSFKWDDSVDQCIPEALSTTELPCLIPSWDNQTDNGTELPDYVQNPCKPQPNSHCKFTYKHHYIDISKFIQCDRSGNARVKSCPTSFKWDDSVDQCIPEALSTTELPCLIPSWDNQTDNGTELPDYVQNPCKPQPNSHCKFTYKHHYIDISKFIQCDRSGNARVKSCPTSFKWDDSVDQCIPEALSTTELPCLIPSWDNQTDNGTELPDYVQNPCKPQPNSHCKFTYKHHYIDISKFIQCDRSGNARVKSCPTSFKWDDSVDQCIPEALSTTELPCLIPSWDNQTDNGTELPDYVQNPCKPQPNSHCKFTYKHHYIDISKFIQCDRSGNARVKSCPTSFKWDDSVDQCIPEALSTTELPCLIPSWDNQTDNGTELPDYVQNPCKPQPNSHCKFTYKHHYIDISKFIQCDRSGNARVKSCPTSFKWDDSVDQCIPEALSTTELPCLIPSWDNQTDNGTELPDYVQNPCKPQPNSHCKFTYKHHYIDISKFIQCDRSGNARVKSCPTSFKWDDSVDQCIPEALSTTELPCLIPSWDNQTDNGTELPDYVQNPCKPQPNSHCKFTYKHHYIDISKFIQCDRSGNARVKSCPTSFKWDDSVDQCIPEALSTTELPCLIPSWDNQTDNGTELPDYVQNPCKPQPNSHCKFTYKHHYIDISKFIQCDRSGNARVKSCPTSFKWDDSVDQCIPEALSTTELPCLIPSWDNQTDNGTELPDYVQNPCKPQPNSHCKFTYKHHYIDISKFIQCDRSGNARVKSCPTSFKWDDSVDQCIPEALSTTELPCLIPSWDNQTDNGTELPDYVQNPCKPQPNSHCKFTYKHHYIDISKFIQCDRSGNARVKSCPTSFKWDDSVDQCIPEVFTTVLVPCLIPSGVNETQKVPSFPLLYPNPCHVDLSRSCKFAFKPFLLDPHKFIQCDKFGNASIKSCQQSFKWFQNVQQCLPHCQIPTWVNQNELGSPLPQYYPNPCIADPHRACLFVYKPFLLDQYKFIVCDKNSNALIKTCPPNFKWIDNAGKCSIDNIQTTPKSECDVPVWVNQKEQGTPLKPFYPNPCPIDSTRKCEFIYLIYILDQHKFIQCTRFGKAVLKSCPLNSIWDNYIKQCSIQTTIRPACTVPIWVNPNEKGLPLPSYLPDPCKRTSIQTCKYFNYVMNSSKFIECDQYGEAWVKTCPSFSKWDNAFKMCTKMNNR